MKVKKEALPPTLTRSAAEYWKLWSVTGDPKALLAWSRKIGEERG